MQIEVPDPLFKAIVREATARGSDPATVAVSALHQHFDERALSENDGAAEDSLRALFGAEDQAPVTGLDNEAIDADLAREYGRGLES